jgi:hypothetical protein
MSIGRFPVSVLRLELPPDGNSAIGAATFASLVESERFSAVWF